MTRWLERLTARLAQPLPGADAHRRMAPTLAYGRHDGPPSATAKPAAVAIIIASSKEHGWHFPLTVRPMHMKDHAGQVCLPGGGMECSESDWLCAMREANEELEVRRESLSLLGRLTPLYVFGTDFLMQPVVFLYREPPQWRPNPDEVSEVLAMPIDEFVGLADAELVRMNRSGMQFESPAWPWQGYHVWGATAMVLAEWQDILRELRSSTDE